MNPGEHVVPVIVVTAVVVIATVLALSLVPRPPTSAFPPGWILPGTCQCTVAIGAGQVYDLNFLNGSPDPSSANYSITAYNLKSGHPAWTSGPFSTDSASGLGTPETHFFEENDTLTLVVSSYQLTATGQSFNSTRYCSVYVLEWQASSGEFGGGYRSGEGPFCPEIVSVASDGGWVTVASVSGQAPANLTVETFPELGSSLAYASWIRSFPEPGLSQFGFLEMGQVFMTRGLVVVVTGEAGNLTRVLSGSNGSVQWQGILPDRFVPDLSGPFSYNIPRNVAVAGPLLYYVAQNGTNVSIRSFDLTGHTPALVATSNRLSALFTDLTVGPSGELLLSDSNDSTYWAYSPAGHPLWNTTLTLRFTGGSAWALLVDPIVVGDHALFLSLGGLQESFSGKGSVTTTTPFELVDGSTGVVLWSSTYQSTWDGGNPPSWYLPVSASGPYLLYLFDGTARISDISGYLR